MTSSSNSTPSPYSLTAKCKREQDRLQLTKERLNIIKAIMLEKGIETEVNLKSQEKILFAVVKWLTSEDLNESLKPLELKGNEEQNLINNKREQYRRDKQDLAYTKLRECIERGTIGKWKNARASLERLDVLRLVLEHIEDSVNSAGSTLTFSTSNTPQTSFPTPAPTPQALPSFFPVPDLQNYVPPIFVVPIIPSTPSYIQYVASMMTVNNNIRMNSSNGFMIKDLLEAEENKENRGEGTIRTNMKEEEEEIDVIN